MSVRGLVLLVALAGCGKEEEEDTAGIETAYPLAKLVSEASLIAVGTLGHPDFDRDEVVFSFRESLKGAAPLKRIRLKVESFYHSYQEALRRHLLVPGTPVVLLHHQGAFVLFVNRFFVHGYGAPDSDSAWLVTVTERWLTRSFNGDATGLADVIRGSLAGQTTLPPYDDSRPLLTRKSLLELPVWGEPVDEAYLPKPFRR